MDSFEERQAQIVDTRANKIERLTRESSRRVALIFKLATNHGDAVSRRDDLVCGLLVLRDLVDLSLTALAKGGQ